MGRGLTGLALLLVGGFVICVEAAESAPRAGSPPPPGSSYALPRNFYGAHLLVGDGADGTRGDKHLRWARYLLGRWGHAKTLLGGIDKHADGPRPEWIDYVNKCYELELIPFLRLAGHMAGPNWVKPEADAPGDYTSIAQAVKRVVEGLPRSDLCPLYIEVWNEPNCDIEWSGKTNPAEYAAFFVHVAKAIRSIGDARIKILNGGLATGPEWTRMLCEAEPDFIRMFDYWSCHPYPMNRPPSLNLHDKTVPPDSDLAIDSYLLELDVLRKSGRGNVEVMITETGWDLGNAVYSDGERYPIINEYNRADYIMRAFRDCWPKWSEIVAVFPFEFCSKGWGRFDWVYPASGINPDGSPTKPHYQYTVVAALAKPTDTAGAINGTLIVGELGVRLEGADVTAGGKSFVSDPMGNYFLARLEPGPYTVKISKTGFRPAERKVKVTAGKNTVVDVELGANKRATLTGTVRSGDDGERLSGVTVTLEPGDVTTRTDRNGEYVLKDCIPARYKLCATADGRYRYEVANVGVDVSETNRHDFKLGQRADLPGENVAKNAGMEAGGGGGGKDWIALGFEPLVIDPDVMREPPGRMTEGVAHTGRLSQSMQLFEKETVIRQITHYNTVEPSKRYAGGIWIKTSCQGRDAGAWITFDATDNGGAALGRIGPSRKITGRSNWTWVSLEGIAPEGSKRLSLNLHTQGTRGVAYFDDAFIGEVADGE